VVRCPVLPWVGCLVGPVSCVRAGGPDLFSRRGKKGHGKCFLVMAPVTRAAAAPAAAPEAPGAPAHMVPVGQTKLDPTLTLGPSGANAGAGASVAPQLRTPQQPAHSAQQALHYARSAPQRGAQGNGDVQSTCPSAPRPSSHPGGPPPSSPHPSQLQGWASAFAPALRPRPLRRGSKAGGRHLLNLLPLLLRPSVLQCPPTRRIFS
jgi:hypothetical protein